MNTIDLGYNQKDYKEKYSQEFIIGFNHGSMAKGPIEINSVKEIVKGLNEKASHVTKVVNFNENSMDKDLIGGSCSSIALRVGLVGIKCLQESEDDESLTNCVRDIVEKIHNLPRSGRKEVRNLQAAYNTIQVDTSVKVDDISQEKIKALVSFFDMKVCQSSEELLVEETDSCEKVYDEMINKLKSGVYLVRVLQKENNHKLETQGHSTIYIKGKNGKELYFDTQLGLYDVSKAQDLIYRSMCSAKKQFAVDVCKFHQLAI